MSVDEVIGIIVGIATIYFLWKGNELSKEQNLIFREQNRIFSTGQKGKPMTPTPSQITGLRRYWPMLGMAILAITTWAALGYDYYDRHFSRNPIRTSVRVGRFTFNEAQPGSATIGQLRAGASTGMNLGVRNYGPLPAQRVRVAGQIHWFAPLTKSAEDDAWSEFRRTAPLGKPQDVDVTGEQYDAFQSQTLTDSDLRDIGDHKLVLYVLMYYEYQDSGGSHYTESCHALQDVPKGISIPGGLRVTSGEIVWHICNDHNTIR